MVDENEFNIMDTDMEDDDMPDCDICGRDTQPEIDRLRAENEKLEAALLAEHQAAVDQFGIAEGLRDENSRLEAKLDDMRKLMDRKRAVKCGLCGRFDCTTDHDKPTYLR